MKILKFRTQAPALEEGGKGGGGRFKRKKEGE